MVDRREAAPACAGALGWRQPNAQDGGLELFERAVLGLDSLPDGRDAAEHPVASHFNRHLPCEQQGSKMEQ